MRQLIRYVDTHPNLPVRVCLNNGNVEAYKIPGPVHGAVAADIIALIERWDQTRHIIRYMGVDLRVGPASMRTPDASFRSAGIPPTAPGQGMDDLTLPYLTVVVEVACGQKLRTAPEKVTEYFTARTTIQLVLIIKIWKPR